jgi:integrase
MVNALIADWKASLSASTVYNRRITVKKLCALLHAHGAPDCETLLPKIKRPEPREVIATSGQLASLLRLSPTWLRLFITLTWQMGLRFSEAMRVTPASHNADRQTVTILRKGGKVKTLPTTPDVETFIAACGDTTAQEEVPYVSILRGKPLPTHTIRSAWWNLLKKAGIENLRPHDLRRTVITAAWRVTHDVRQAQQMAGHDNLASTAAYLAPLSEGQLRDLQKLLDFRNFHSEVKQ